MHINCKTNKPWQRIVLIFIALAFKADYSEALCISDQGTTGGGGGGPFDMEAVSDEYSKVIQTTICDNGSHMSELSMTFSNGQLIIRSIACAWRATGEQAGEIYKTRGYNYGGYASGFTYWERDDGNHSRRSDLYGRRNQHSYNTQYLNGPLVSFYGRSGAWFDNYGVQTNTCFCPRVNLTLTSAPSNMEMDMGTTTCNGFGASQSLYDMWSTNPCAAHWSENQTFTYISGSSVCAQSSDPALANRWIMVLLHARIAHGGTWYYHGGATINHYFNVFFRPRCSYSRISQATNLTSMRILLEESTTQGINWTHTYANNSGFSCGISYQLIAGGPRLTLRGSTITLAVSHATWTGTFTGTIRGYFSSYPDSRNPGVTLDVNFTYQIIPICRVSNIIQRQRISNMWIWLAESSDQYVETYYHTYTNNWSGHDPCTISYQITSTNPALSLHNNNQLLRLSSRDPSHVSTFTITYRAYYGRWSDRTTPTNENTQSISFTVVPQCYLSSILNAHTNLAPMTVPINGYIRQSFGHYYHEHRRTWQANWRDTCVISYRSDTTNDRDDRGTIFKVYNDTMEVELYTPDDQKIGTWTSTMVAYYSDWSDRSTPANQLVQTIPLTITPRCVLTEYEPLVNIASDIRYQIGVTGVLEIPFSFAFVPADCNYYQIYSALVNNGDAPSWFIIDQMTATPKITINTSDGSQAGIYTVVLTSQINHIPIVNTNTDISFTMTLTADGCVLTTFVEQTITDMSFTINYNAPYLSQSIPDFHDTMTDGGTVDCGRKRYSLYEPTTLTSGVVSFVDGGNRGTHELRVLSTDPTHVGTHQAYLYVELFNYEELNPVIRIRKDISIIIDGACITTAFTFKTQPKMLHMITRTQIENLWYENEQLDSVSTAAGFYGSSSDYYLSYCGRRTYTFTGLFYKDGTNAPNVMSLYQNGNVIRTLQLNGTNSSHYGQYDAKVNVLLTSWPTFATEQFVVDVEVVPNCLGSTITSHAIGNLETPVGSIITTVFGESTHIEQGAYDNYCGDVEYILTGEANASFITMDVATRTLTMYPQSNADVGTYTVSVTTRLQLYPTQLVEQTFQVVVTAACGIGTYVAGETLISPLIHHIGIDAAMQFAFDFPYTPCSPRLIPTYTFTVEKKNTAGTFEAQAVADASTFWLSIDTIVPTSPNIIINATDPADEGEYNVIISSSLNTHPTRTSATTTLLAHIFLQVDACYKTTFLSDPSFEAMEFRIKSGEPATTSVFTPVSNDVTANQGLDCGLLKYTLTTDRTNIITSIDNVTNTVSVLTENGDDLGDHTITVVVELLNYPVLAQYISKTTTFVVTITSICQETTFIVPATPDILYQINSPAQYVLFDGYKDVESYSNPPNDGVGFCGERTYVLVTTHGAITFDQTQFTIYTNDYANVSTVVVSLTATLVKYPTVSQTYSFTTYIVNDCNEYSLVPFDTSVSPFTDIEYQVGGDQKVEIVQRYAFDIDNTMWALGFNLGAEESICGKTTQTLQMTNGNSLPSLINFTYSDNTQLGLVDVLSDRSLDVGEYELEIVHSSVSYVSGGPTFTMEFKLIVTELAQSNSNLLPFLDPRPNSEYEIQVGERFEWTFSFKDPENDPVTTQVDLRSSKITACNCSEVQTSSIGIQKWTFTPDKSMSGELVAVLVTLNDPINTANQSFLVQVRELPEVFEEEKVDKREKAKAKLEELLNDNSLEGEEENTTQGRKRRPKKENYTEAEKEEIAEIAEKQEEAEVKMQEFTESPVGEKLTSGETLTAEEIEEIAESIAAPVPVIEEKDDEGGIKMKFTKPIAVPSQEKKSEMVGLLLDNGLIEMNLSNADSGTSIKGEPYFDEANFARRLSEQEDEGDVDPKTAVQLRNLIAKLKKTIPNKRRLSGDFVSDEKKGFKWTIASYERTGFKFAVEYNDPMFVSEDGKDQIGIEFHDADKYLIGEDGLSVPVTKVSVAVPKQMRKGDTAIVNTVAYAIKNIIQAIVFVSIIILFLQNGSIQRLLGLLLTLQLVAHLGTVSYGLPQNIVKMLYYIKYIVTFDQFTPIFGMQNVLSVTKTQPWSQYFDRIGYSSQSLVVNMGLLCTIFFIIAAQLFAVVLLTITAGFFKTNQALRNATTNLGNAILPQAMFFILFAFLEILVCMGIQMIPNNDVARLLTLEAWTSGDFLQFVVGCVLVIACLAFFAQQLKFAVSKNALLAKIAFIIPGENPEAKGVKYLLKAYRTAIKIRDAKVNEGKQPKALNILVSAMKKKIAQKQGEMDGSIMELPMPTMFMSSNKKSLIEKMGAQDETDQIFLEGGEEIELRPSSAIQEDSDEDVFANSASSFMSEKMRRTAEMKTPRSGPLSQIMKKELLSRFMQFGKAGFEEEQHEIKQKAKLEFLQTYSSVIELAQKKEYEWDVEDRIDELEQMKDAMDNEEYNIGEWLDQYNWELVLAKDLKVYSRASLAYHFLFAFRRALIVAAIFSFTQVGSMQLMTFMYTSIASLIYVGWVRPFKNEGTNLLEMFNESCIFLLSTMILTMESTRGIMDTFNNPLLSGPMFRMYFGWAFIVVIIALVTVNAVFIVKQMVDDCKHSPIVKKRMGRVRRYMKKVNAWDENECSCACASCSGIAKGKKCLINRTPSDFKIEVVPCDFDTTLLESPDKKKYKFSLTDKGENVADKNDSLAKHAGGLARIEEENDNESPEASAASLLIPERSSTDRSSEEHSNSDSDEELMPKQRQAKQARYVDWYEVEEGFEDEPELTEDQHENLEEKTYKQQRYKQWQVKSIVGEDNDLIKEEDDGQDGQVRGVSEFEQRQTSEKQKYLANLANGDERAMVHLGTINENEEDEGEESDDSFDKAASAKKASAEDESAAEAERLADEAAQEEQLDQGFMKLQSVMKLVKGKSSTKLSDEEMTTPLNENSIGEDTPGEAQASPLKEHEFSTNKDANLNDDGDLNASQQQLLGGLPEATPVDQLQLSSDEE